MSEIVFKMGELFCGPGGIAIGVDAANRKMAGLGIRIEHAWATDYHSDTCKTYASNIFRTDDIDYNDDEETEDSKKKKVLCADIRMLNFERLRNKSQIDGLSFGFPCNDFSIVGEQKGIEGRYGPLYSYAAMALRYFKPKWFFAENVSGLQSSNEGTAFKKILQEFSECGYKLYPHHYRFEDYGVPQRRHRIIIIGIRSDLSIEYRVPKPTMKTKTAQMALHNIPDNATNNELTRQSDVVVERLKHIKPGQNAFNADLPAHLQLNVKGARISQIYKRLDPSAPAYTVTGSGGGGTHIYHWEHPRALTNRERARLQTFPDSFTFFGSKESVRRQIGMAVPPDGVEEIMVALMKSFIGESYSNVNCNILID